MEHMASHISRKICPLGSKIKDSSFKFSRKTSGIVRFLYCLYFGFFVYFEKGENMLAVSSIKGGCSVLFSGFNSKLWIRIMLVSIFFAIGQMDGTLNVLTAKFVSLIKGKNKLLPWVFYFLTLILAAIGAKYIGVLILIMPIAAAMAKEQKLDLFLTGIAVAIGGAVGGYGDCGYKYFCREWDYIG